MTRTSTTSTKSTLGQIAAEVDRYIRRQIEHKKPIDPEHIANLSGWDPATIRRTITASMQRHRPARGPRR